MPTIPDAWYEEKVREEIATQEQSNAMKSFLAGNISADEAAKILTKDANQAALEDTTSSEKLIDELCNLWGFLIDFILEWPILETVDILHAISQLPHVDRTGKDALGAFCDDNGVVGEPKLWEDLPKFWNSLSDTWDCKLHRVEGFLLAR
ncbi:uncharacterized protein F4822DRAFT_399088 [Hypoxylon trugodes]|uniref:uncharacterized protein n=1 Tax=Hypoxylon trugodes TaxID=326681 RepID=UPI002195C73D|nr:uncharacterized protein F4822DRAFT_399088 [Hypoxylon trugodes]KAI1389646.1 hypothetical protein F4822DRAFT_399088 [Hypoxylon trugodes]